MSVRAGIVVTGTEVLSGRVTDRNGPWVSERLGELGCEVAQIVCVGDRHEDLRSALAFLRDAGVDLIFTTGGLGPTADDLTAEIVAGFAGREMVLDEAMERRIAEIVAGFAKRMRFDPEALRDGTRKQAMIPEGAIALDPAGTAPGLVVETSGSGPPVVVLPGPPRELQAMWPAALAAAPVTAVLARADSYEVTTMKMFGIPESTLARTLREIGRDLDLDPLEITTCLRRGAELEIDVRHRVTDAALRESLFASLRERHGRFVYTETGETIDGLVATLLAGRSIGVAESCTGGLLAARLTDLPGASAYFKGGVVSYADAAKTDLLGVPAELIASRGAVSPEVAVAMAEGARERFDAELGVGITGIAGPGGGSEEKPVGYVCICVLDGTGSVLARDPQIPGGRDDVRDRSVSVALHMIRRLLLGEDLPF
ncbi:MAG TPA: competence/damage-inducible protein A [Solirubrobacterales bacterium]|nr:competence/damage-inducible protein A [Solirubrobacterales bacterium]